MASMQDVAKKAKVGVGTVSRVINDSGYVSDKTRKKVLRIIKELEYTPNELARNLLHNRTNIIAVVIPDVSNPFFAWLVDEIEKELRKYDYKTLLCNTVGDKTNEEACLSMLERSVVDGILSGTHTLDFSQYSKVKKPMVFFDVPSMDAPVITVNHTKGGKLAAEALIRCGCREVVQFADDVTADYPFLKRHQVFQSMMEEAGIICHSYHVKWNEFDNAYFESIVENCNKKYPNVDGVFGVDTLATYYMKYALMHGKKVPDDLKIVAYDGTYLLKSVYPTISVVQQPVRELAVKGVETILNLIDDRPCDPCIELDVSFKKGMSTL